MRYILFLFLLNGGVHIELGAMSLSKCYATAEQVMEDGYVYAAACKSANDIYVLRSDSDKWTHHAVAVPPRQQNI